MSMCGENIMNDVLMFIWMYDAINDDFWRYYDDGCICIHGMNFDDSGFNPIVWIEVFDVMMAP